MKNKEITIMDVANKGNWGYHNGENRCIYCGEYQFQNEHDKDCPLGKLILIINNKMKLYVLYEYNHDHYKTIGIYDDKDVVSKLKTEYNNKRKTEDDDLYDYDDYILNETRK